MKKVLVLASLVWIYTAPASAQTAAPANVATQTTEIQGIALGSSFEQFVPKLAGCRDYPELASIGIKSCKQSTRDAAAGQRAGFTIEPGDNEFVFDKGKLVMIKVQAENFDAALDAATEKWGKPTKLQTDTVQNGYGATFQVKTARWERPDGAIVTIRESVTFLDATGYTRFVFFTVATPDEMRALEPEAKKPAL